MKASILAVLTALFSFSSAAMAANCSLVIEATDSMTFNQKSMTVSKACKEVSVTIKHVGKLPKAAMGHNWVLAKKADAQNVVNSGAAAGPGAGYVAVDKKGVIAATKLVGGGESDTVKFSTKNLKPSDSYEFFCTFPGHSALMKGTFVVTK